jgi:hypothetical protein
MCDLITRTHARSLRCVLARVRAVARMRVASISAHIAPSSYRRATVPVYANLRVRASAHARIGVGAHGHLFMFMCTSKLICISVHIPVSISAYLGIALHSWVCLRIVSLKGVSSAQIWFSDRALLLLYEAKRKMASILPTHFVTLVTLPGYNSSNCRKEKI